MCSRRSWFSTYQVIDDGTFLMGNNVSCKTGEIGSIKIKMSNGIVIMLTEVRYVPKLKNNSMSLVVLDS